MNPGNFRAFSLIQGSITTLPPWNGPDTRVDACHLASMRSPRDIGCCGKTRGVSPVVLWPDCRGPPLFCFVLCRTDREGLPLIRAVSAHAHRPPYELTLDFCSTISRHLCGANRPINTDCGWGTPHHLAVFSSIITLAIRQCAS